MWTEDDKRQLAEHCCEHDRLMAEEHAPAPRDELVTKEDAADLIYKRIRRPAPQPEEDADFSGWERWLSAHLANNNTELVEVFSDAVAIALAKVQETRAADKAELAALCAADKAELAALRTQVETLTATKADVAGLKSENAALRAKVDVLTAAKADAAALVEKLESDRRERALECANFAVEIAELRSQMKVLGGYLSVNFDPPREFWKRFNDAG